MTVLLGWNLMPYNFSKVITFFVFALILGLVSCQGYSVTGGPGRIVNPPLLSESANPSALVGVSSIVVLPVKVDPSLRIPEAEQRALTEEFEQALKRSFELKIITAQEVLLESAKTSSVQDSSRVPTPQWRTFDGVTSQKLAAKVGADAYAEVVLFEYQQNSGSRVGAEDPAQVHFSAALISVASGREIWRADYSVKDEALTDNLFKAEARLKNPKSLGWQSARDLLVRGFDMASKDLASRRLKGFSSGVG